MKWQPVSGDETIGPLGLKIGHGVILHSLSDRTLNGCQGHILSYNSEKDRYAVQLHSRSVLIRPANIKELFLRVDGRWAAGDDQTANFLKLPIPIKQALRWEDQTQLQSNTHAISVGRHIPLCHQHNQRPLTISKSLIPGAGRGVFADEEIPEGEIITQFCGVLRPPNSVGSEAYSQITSLGIIEGDPTVVDREMGVAQLINDASCIDESCDALKYLNETGAKRNCAMAAVDGLIVAVALRKIEAGEELYHTYGMGYWLGRIQKAALLAHDLELAKKADEVFMESSPSESVLLESPSKPIQWHVTPSLSLADDKSLYNSASGATATADDCRRLCWARLGVESFTLPHPRHGPIQCHTLAAYALVMDIPVPQIPKWCLDNCE